MTSERTSIQITRETKERLDKRGKKGDTYEDIIRRLLDDTIGPILAIPKQTRKK